jgi:hypothetical protein
MLNEKERALINKVEAIDDIHRTLQSLYDNSKNTLAEIERVESDINAIINEKTSGFPWLADAISQYHEMRDLKIAEFLEKKLRPGLSSAERVRELAAEKREFHKKFRIARNLLKYYDALFPWLQDLIGENIDELLVAVSEDQSNDDEHDPVQNWITDGEFRSLSPTERNQRALDRWWKSRKSKWQIGRDYERYIGYKYEQHGYSVYYQGIEKGLEDLGRDLICKKRDEVVIVQCKYWKENKIIHEKHINQLFGTTVEYYIKNVSQSKPTQLELFNLLHLQKSIKAVLITSAQLSPTAKQFADVLGVDVIDGAPFKEYPSIKCNVSYRDGTKIYHLPFDQQYDRTTIDEERNECYVKTVAEAERLGFRRAWRWRGNKQSNST